MKSDAVRIGPDSGRITLCANSFSDSYVGAGAHKRRDDDRDAAGLVISESADVLVNGNAFTGITSEAVSLRASETRSAITNNYFVNTKAGVETIMLDEVAKGSNFSVEK